MLLLLLTPLPAAPKKQPNPEMSAIRKVFITGLNLGQVEWAYKNFSQNKACCLKPVATPEDADAIVRIDPAWNNANDAPAAYQEPIWVNCRTSGSNTTCLDSSGYEYDTYCSSDGRGNVVCTSTYGPSLSATVLDLLRTAARSTFVTVSVYTKDGKSRIWSAQDSTMLHTWAYDLSKHVGCVQQKCPVTHFKPCDTRWYFPSELGPDGKLLKTNQ
jgi:hypothetical protein